MPPPFTPPVQYRWAMAADMHEALSRLMRRWRRQGIELLPPATAAEVTQLFERLGGVATTDVIALYTTLGGMAEMDDDDFQLWSLEEIASRAPTDDGVLFADYLVSSWEYRLVPSAGACNAVWGSLVRHHTGLTLEAFLISLEAEKDFLDRYC